MEIKISRDKFLKASLLAEKNTGKNINLPILNSFLISAQKGTVKIITTNLESYFEISAPSKIIKEGKIVAPAKILNSIILNLKDEFIDFKEENNNLEISTNNSKSILKTNSLEDFPIPPKFKEESYFQIKILDFFNGLKSVFFSASLSYLKPEIASVYFYNNNKENKCVFVATDSFRLTEKIIFDSNIDCKFNILFPVKAVQEIIRILEEVENKEIQLKIGYNKNEFLISAENFIFFSRLTEGSFVDYVQFIPKTSLGEVVIEKDKFMDALKAASIFLSRSNEIIIELPLKKEIAEFKTSNSDIGEYFSQIAVFKKGFKDFKDEKIKLTVNLKYLLEGISQILSSKIILKINEEGKPIVIQGENEKSLLYLLMPMKI